LVCGILNSGNENNGWYKMRHDEILKYVIKSIKHTNLRSWLTMIGIFVGILAIVVLIGLADGLKKDITGELSKFGSNSLVITPSNVEGGLTQMSAFSAHKGKLFDNDYEKIKKIGGIDYISRIIMGKTTMNYKGESKVISLYGVEPELFQHTVQLDVEKGRFLSENEQGVVILGNDVANEVYNKKIMLNTNLLIANKSYKVVGIIKKTGNSFFNPDNLVFIDYKDSKDIFRDILAKNEINAIRLTVSDKVDVKEITQEVEDVLLASHKVNEDDKDFTIITSDYINEKVGGITNMLTLFLGAVAGVSLIVGGIGITNTMFMNVIERTKEIGVLKSLGAKKNEIIEIFVVESTLLGIVGGFLGVVVGGILLFIIQLTFNITTSFPIWVAILSILFSAFIGFFSGLIPAKNASSISPIESLRYE